MENFLLIWVLGNYIQRSGLCFNEQLNAASQVELLLIGSSLVLCITGFVVITVMVS